MINRPVSGPAVVAVLAVLLLCLASAIAHADDEPRLPSAVNAPGAWSTDEEVDGSVAAVGIASRTKPSTRADLDHTIAYADGGVTTPLDLAPLCRHHHRLKTHAGWTYRPLDPVTDPGTYLWTDPHGLGYLRTPTGTTNLTSRCRHPRPRPDHATAVRDGAAAGVVTKVRKTSSKLVVRDQLSASVSARHGRHQGCA